MGGLGQVGTNFGARSGGAFGEPLARPWWGGALREMVGAEIEELAGIVERVLVARRAVDAAGFCEEEIAAAIEVGPVGAAE